MLIFHCKLQCLGKDTRYVMYEKLIGEPFHVTHVDGCLDLIESEFTHHQKCRAYSQVFSSEEQDGFKKNMCKNKSILDILKS